MTLATKFTNGNQVSSQKKRLKVFLVGQATPTSFICVPGDLPTSRSLMSLSTRPVETSTFVMLPSRKKKRTGSLRLRVTVTEREKLTLCKKKKH